jgi:hypothetical protein
MFERFTEKARRVIFFARYEASAVGSPQIHLEHLLLAILREDAVLKARVGDAGANAFRKQLELESGTRAKISVSLDMPLSAPSKRALSYAAEESEKLGQQYICPGHLLLGLLRDGNVASSFLQQFDIDLLSYREVVRTTPEEGVRQPVLSEAVRQEPVESVTPKAASLNSTVAALERMIALELTSLNALQRLKRKPWTRLEALGYLVDLATAHHEWLGTALVESRLAAPGYPAEARVAVERYREYSWPNLVKIWVALNRLLLHVLVRVSEEELNVQCRIGLAEPCTLLVVMQRYVGMCEDLVGQITAKLE